MLPELSISESLSSNCPDLRLGLLYASIQVADRPAALDTFLEEVNRGIELKMTAESVRTHPVIAATRAAYKKLGKDPSRYRPSAEALMRRAVSGKGLYKVSNAVDALNAVSLRTGFSIGGYDADQIQGPIKADVGLESDDYEGIGRGPLNINGLTVLRDDLGPFGCPTSDSMRTRVQPHTRNFLMVFFDYDAKGNIQEAFDMSRQVLSDYAQGADFQQRIHP
jgi:DNA/RNA-binding domain of Phe-tRNA-synthetase-like protein